MVQPNKDIVVMTPIHRKLYYTTMDCDFFEKSLCYNQLQSQGENSCEDLNWLTYSINTTNQSQVCDSTKITNPTFTNAPTIPTNTNATTIILEKTTIYVPYSPMPSTFDIHSSSKKTTSQEESTTLKEDVDADLQVNDHIYLY